MIYYNDRLSEFSGAEKMEDGSWHWDGLVHPDDLKATEAAWKQAVDSDNVCQTEHRIQMKNGEYKWFLSRAFPHKDDEGTIIKWFGTATDIHASKTEAAILEEEVNKRTRELHELNASLF